MRSLRSALLITMFVNLSAATAYCEDKLPFNLVTREQWGAQWVNPASYSYSAPVKFTLHHTARTYPANLEAAKEEMRNIQRGVLTWGIDTAYHYIISPQGDVFQGIPDDKLGSHALNDNYNNIGICFMGNYMNDNPTPQSLDALVNLVRHLNTKYPAMAKRVAQQNNANPRERFFILHRETYATLCPGDKLVALQNELFGRMVSKSYVLKASPAEYRSYNAVMADTQAEFPAGGASLQELLKASW